MLLRLVSLAALLAASSGQQCDVPNSDKFDCGFMGVNQATCEADGCCWEPVEPNPNNVPWCFYDASFEDPCKTFTWTGATGPGFDDAFYEIMRTNYLSQLNVEGVGAVVAAPDEVKIRNRKIQRHNRDGDES
jgi:hypothetical protein